MATMVNKLKDELQNELVTVLYEDETIDQLMREPDHVCFLSLLLGPLFTRSLDQVGRRRQAVRDREAVLQKAMTILNDSRQFTLPTLAGATPPPMPSPDTIRAALHTTPLAESKAENKLDRVSTRRPSRTKQLMKPPTGQKENVATGTNIRGQKI